jgi:hypothetical protein
LSDAASVSNDTRLLLAGVIAFAALVAYLVVAFARMPAPPASVITPSLATKVAPWTPVASKFMAIPRGGSGEYTVRVTPTERGAARGKPFGAVAQVLILHPRPGRSYLVGLWLRGSRPGRIAVELNEFRGRKSRYPVQTTVPAMAKWRHFRFGLTVKGSWLGLAMVVNRQANARARTWFAIRGLTLELLPRG